MSDAIVQLQVDPEKFAHARRAKERFDVLIAREFAPLIRTVTRNPKLKVESWSHAPAVALGVDGTKSVFLQTPWALGETLEHNTALCALRDDGLLSLCPACRISDEVRADMWHESAHITERSFDEMSRQSLWQLVKDRFQHELDLLGQHEVTALKTKVIVDAKSSLHALSFVDKWLPMAWNVVEDIYVNRRLYQARPGVEPGMQATTVTAFTTNMVDRDTGKTVERGRDLDALMVPYLRGHGLAEHPELRAYFGPDHAGLFDDKELNSIIDAIPSECGIGDRFDLSIQLLVRLRELGFLPRKQDSLLPPPPPPQTETPSPEPPPPGPSDEKQPEQEPGESGEGQPQAGDSDEDEDEGEGSSDSDEDDGETTDDSEADGSGEADDEDESEEPEPGEGASSDEDGEGEDDEAGDGESEGPEASGEPDEDGEDDGGDTEGQPASGGEQSLTDDEIDQIIEKAIEVMNHLMGHGDDGPTKEQEEAMTKADLQITFDDPSVRLTGLEIVEPEEFKNLFHNNGIAPQVQPNESIMARPLNHLRVVFAENKRTGMTRNLRRGRSLDKRHLHRAGSDDYRIFGRRDVPKTRDWSVVVGVDFSSSNNSNGALRPVKEASATIAELLHRLGIPFQLEGHTGRRFFLTHTIVKDFATPWNKGSLERLNKISGMGGNMDGHSMERYRKLAEAQHTTDKLILYFTDGEMHGSGEEYDVLIKNIEICRRQGIHLLAVSYQNDSPTQLGLDTIQFDSGQDVASIVSGLGKYLSTH